MATTPLKYLHQYFTTTLNVGGGLTNSQTTGIVIQAVSGLDITKPGVACLTYADPINTSTAEWITYTSIDGSNELQGVVRGTEGFGAKTHSNGAVVAFPLSESHINNLNAMFDTTGLDIAQISTPASPSSGRNKIYFKSDGKAYTLTSAGVEAQVGSNSASTETFIIAGTFPSSATTNLSKTWFAPAALTISKVDLYVDTAGSGTGSTVVDINKNGTTITASTKLTLTTTQTSNLDVTPSVTAVAKGDAITIDVDSVTATTAPSNGYILIHYTRD